MHIGIFTETYRPTINGVVISIDTFKRELEQRGHTYYIFAPENHDRPKNERRVYRLPAITLPAQTFYPLAQPLPYHMAQRHLPPEIMQKLDIIHIQHFSAMGQLGLSVAKHHGIPSVYTYHTMAELYTHYLPFVGSLTDPLIRSWTRHTASRADHVVTPTKSVKKYLRDIGVTEPISIIPTGIETDRYERTARAYLQQRFRIPTKEQIIIFVGRLAAEKNVEFLLHAFRQVKSTMPDAHLLLVGDGPDRVAYQRLIDRWGISAAVTFAGFQTHRETITLLGAADIFAFPSVTDTQGIVVLEAMAAGTVPVAIDRYGPHDIIRHNQTGMLCDLNLEKFSDILISLLQDHDKRHRLARAAKMAVRRYDQAVTAEAMEELYVKLTRHPGTK